MLLEQRGHTFQSTKKSCINTGAAQAPISSPAPGLGRRYSFLGESTDNEGSDGQMRKGLIVTELSKREFSEADELFPDCELIHSLGKVSETSS